MSGIPAVPDYLTTAADAFDACAPGHRFSLYCPIWNPDWTIAREEGAKKKAIDQCRDLKAKAVADLLQRLRDRQRALASCFEHALFQPAMSSAPFATGLGNEHPVENGFAFLTPYGLPYLPGSGVKGVLRRAAEELAVMGDPDSGEPADVDLLDVWWLFGFEGERGLFDNPELATRVGVELTDALGRVAERGDLSMFIARIGGLAKPDREDFREEAGARRFADRLTDRPFRRALGLRGALTFWDVFPVPKGKALAVEIMTPHFGEYYQGKTSPHDAGQPTPIPFLALPAGSEFDFHVVCDVNRLPDGLRGRWETVVTRVFHYAFDWLGFGAKTAVGYGQMEADASALEQHEKQLVELREARERDEKLRRAVADLPEDAAWVEQQRLVDSFEDSGRLLDTLEPWLARRESLSPEAWHRLRDALERRWKGIMENPDATQGKKNKPKFKPRSVALAKRLLELSP